MRKFRCLGGESVKLAYLKYFVTVAEKGSIRRAAEELYVSQPNLSRAIHIMEEELGTKVFLRSSHGVTLTELGKSLYYYAKSIQNQMDSIEILKEVSKDKLPSKLSISVARIIISDEIMLNYYQEVQAEHTVIDLKETGIEKAVNHVASRESEIALITVNSIQMPIFRKVLEIKGLEMEELGESPLYVHLNADDLDLDEEGIFTRNLVDYNYLHLPSDYFSNINFSIKFGNIYFSDLRKSITVNNYHTMINMIHHTETFILGNRWQIDELAKGGIRSLPILDCDIQSSFLWIRRKGQELSKEASLFLNLIKEYYQKM